MELPTLVYRTPSEGASVPPGSLNIVLGWSTPLKEEEFVSPRKEEVIQVFSPANLVNYPVTYVSKSNVDNSITLSVSGLPAGEVFRVNLSAGIKDIYGRSTTLAYSWTFVTNGTSADVTPLLPPAYIHTALVPTFTWSVVPSAINYQLQVGDNPDFTSLIGTYTTPSTSLLPAAILTKENSYYWRVRALTSSVTGQWSSPRAFYYGDPKIADTFSPLEQALFRITSHTLEDGNYLNWPNISLTFSLPPSGNYSNLIKLFKEPIIPRNDIVNQYDLVETPVTYVLSNTVVTLTPTEAILPSYKYTLKVLPSLTSSTGIEIGGELIYTFTSRYKPYYCSRLLVKSALGSESVHWSNDDIDLAIHLASLDANIMYQDYLGTIAGEGILAMPEDQVRVSYSTGFMVGRWVGVKAQMILLDKMLAENLRYIGRATELGNYSERLTKDFFEAIKERRKELQNELSNWQESIIGSTGMEMPVKSSQWSPDLINADLYLPEYHWGSRWF